TVRPELGVDQEVRVPASIRLDWSADDAAREIVRGRMEILGPVTVARLARDFDLSDGSKFEYAVLALETEGRILRGSFSRNPLLEAPNSRLQTPDAILEWCDRRLLA